MKLFQVTTFTVVLKKLNNIKLTTNNAKHEKAAEAKYGDPNKLDFIYSELAFGQLFFVAYSSCLFLADTFTQKFKLV
ncbi:hypothetical protein F6I34_02450, partial [Aerococcus tenax]